MPPVEVNEESEVDSQNVQKIDKPYGVLELVAFGKRSAIQGFKFYQKQYASAQAAIDHVNSLGKNGQEVITGLINTAIAFATRTKASNNAPKGDSDEQTAILLKAAMDKGDVVLVSEEEAEAYIPGTREKTATNSLWRAHLDARKKYLENKTEENKALFLSTRAAFLAASEEDFMLAVAAEPAKSTP